MPWTQSSSQHQVWFTGCLGFFLSWNWPVKQKLPCLLFTIFPTLKHSGQPSLFHWNFCVKDFCLLLLHTCLLALRNSFWLIFPVSRIGLSYSKRCSFTPSYRGIKLLQWPSSGTSRSSFTLLLFVKRVVSCTVGKTVDCSHLRFCLVYFFMRSSLWAYREMGNVCPDAPLLEKRAFSKALQMYSCGENGWSSCHPFHIKHPSSTVKTSL